MDDDNNAIGPATAAPDDPTPPPGSESSGGATAVAATNQRTATLARVGLLGIGAAALIAVAMLAIGSTFAPARTLAGSDSTGGAAGIVEELGHLRGGPGRGFGHAFGGITITAIDGNDIALETVDGWTRTITVDGDTEYSKEGDEIGLADLAVGDRIAFRQTLEDDGTWSIDAIAVILPRVGGEVTAIDGSTITVERRDGTTATITVTGATEYWVNGDEAALDDVEVGMLLVARGTENADGSLTASAVRAADPDAFRGPRFGPGGHGFGFGVGPGFHLDGLDPDDTTAPDGDDGAS